jgi:hypothetical protein
MLTQQRSGGGTRTAGECNENVMLVSVTYVFNYEFMSIYPLRFISRCFLEIPFCRIIVVLPSVRHCIHFTVDQTYFPFFVKGVVNLELRYPNETGELEKLNEEYGTWVPPRPWVWNVVTAILHRSDVESCISYEVCWALPFEGAVFFNRRNIARWRRKKIQKC